MPDFSGIRRCHSPVEPNPSINLFCLVLRFSDQDEDFAHAPLPPIPLSELSPKNTDAGRSQPDKVTNGVRSSSDISAGNESGIDLEDHFGETDGRMSNDRDQRRKRGSEEPAIELRSTQSSPSWGPRDALDTGWTTETTV